jgi:hypothetical protein
VSVYISAILSHSWCSFSDAVVDEIAVAATLEKHPVYKRILEPGDRRNSIFNDGSELFLLQRGFSVRLGKRILELGYSEKWGRLLLYKTVRRDFFAVLKRVVGRTGAHEGLVLPEGTILSDSLYDDVNFEAVKERAGERFGPPDLEASQFLSKEELSRMPNERVHYFLLPL